MGLAVRAGEAPAVLVAAPARCCRSRDAWGAAPARCCRCGSGRA